MSKNTTKKEICGKTLNVKNYNCAKNGCPYEPKEPPLQLQLFICPTTFCAGSCRFCVAGESVKEKKFLDIEKLARVLSKLKEESAIRGIAITGGEPFTDVVLLNEIIELIFETFGIEIEVSINTNGSGIKKLHMIRRLAFVDALHISRHHYDDEKNRAYFNTWVPNGEDIRDVVNVVGDPRLFVFNCLLLRDGIGNREEAGRFLEFAGEIGVPKVGFVTPMPVNDYARLNRVSYTEVIGKGDSKLLLTTGYRDYEFCHCQDAVYVTASGRLVELYGRETRNGTGPYVRGLVYGADNVLRTGFGSEAEIIFREML